MRFSLLTVLSVAVLWTCAKIQESPIGRLGEPMTDGNIYDCNRKVVSQQFGIDSDGSLYYAQINDEPWSVNIFRIPSGKLNHSTALDCFHGDSLCLLYAGHPTGMAIQNCEDGKYVWLGNLASKVKGLQYWRSQVVCRVRFEAGATLRPENLESFWFPHSGDINVAIDEEHDRIAFSFYYREDDSARRIFDENRHRIVRVYSLSEALSTPMEEVALSELWIRGGDGAPDPVCDTLQMKMMVHNLSSIKPVAEIGTHCGGDNPEKINSTAWQGFDINDGVVWFSEGGGKTGTYLTGYGYDGTIVFHRTLVYLSQPCSEWGVYGFASPYEDGGVCENEGVCVWNGKLYLGMFTKCAKDGTRSNVFGFPLLEIK